MRILVTGGAGFIGQHLTRALLAQGHEVRVLDILREPIHPAGTRPPLMDEVEFIRGDVADADALRLALDGCEQVYHLAAYQDYLPDFSHFFHVNVAGTALLYELILRDQLPVRRVVVASSQAVYGEGRAECAACGVVWPGQRTMEALDAGQWEVPCPNCGRPTLNAPTSEDSPLSPHNAYGMSKRAQEEIAINLGQRYGIPTVGLRYSIAVGPGQSVYNTYSGAVRSFLVRILAGRPPVVFEDGQQHRDYVGVRDIVAATLLVGTDDRAVGRAFNVGGGREVTVLELAKMVTEVTGIEEEPLLSGEYRAGDTRHIVSDISALRALGWEPRQDLREAIRDYAAWIMRHGLPEDGFDVSSARMRELGVLRSVVGT